MRRQNQNQDWVAGYRAAVEDSTAPGSTWATVVAVIGLLMAGAFLAWLIIGLMGGA